MLQLVGWVFVAAGTLLLLTRSTASRWLAQRESRIQEKTASFQLSGRSRPQAIARAGIIFTLFGYFCLMTLAG